jgi:uncharacterized repeat protein (TIGR01451 family)
MNAIHDVRAALRATRTRRMIRAFSLAFLALFAQWAVPALAQTADLVINQSDSPDPGPAGGVFTYTVRIDNNGPNAATGIVLTDTLPSGSTFVSSTPTQGTCNPPAGGVVVCNLGGLAFLASATVTIKVILPTAGVYTNTATSTSTTSDPNLGNNVNVAENTTAQNASNMTLTVVDAPDPVAAGAAYSYTVTAINNGPAAAASQTLAFTVPTGACITSIPTGTGWVCTPAAGYPLCSGSVSCTRATSLASGASAPALTVPAVANVGGAVTISVQVSSPLPDGNPADNTVTATTTVGGGSSDLQMTKTASPATVGTGTNVTYTLTPRFNGGTPPGTLAPGIITVTDTLAAGLTFVSAAGTGWTCTFAAPTVTCTRPGPFAGNFTNMPTIAIVATVTAIGAISNTASIASGETDPVPANNSSTVAVTGSNSADMQMTKAASLSPVVLNQPFNYTLVAKNNGPVAIAAGQNYTATDTLPAGINLTAAPTGTGWACVTSPATAFPIAGPVTITCTHAGPLAINTNANTITVPVVATSAGSISNTACTALSPPGLTDPTPANDCSTAGITATTSVTSADLRVVSKTASPSPVDTGANLTYVITVENLGPGDATNVVVSDTLASLVTTGGFQSATPSQGTCTPNTVTAGPTVTLNCNLGTLLFGDIAQVTVVVRPLVALTGNRTNTATINSTDVGDPARANNTGSVTSTVNAVADVIVTKVDTPDPVQAGTPLTYVLTARNNGLSTASAVVVTDVLPTTVAFTSLTSTGAPVCTTPAVNSIGGTVTCTWATIATVSQQTATIIVRPLTGVTTIHNDATITTSTTESNTANNTGSSDTTVTAAAVDMIVNKVDSVDPVALGGTTRFTVTVTNGGPSFATNVVMTDTFPVGSPTATFSYQGNLVITPSTAGSCVEPAVNATSGTLTCTFAGVANGAVITIQYDMRAESISTPVSGTTFNGAVVTANETELQAANNSTVNSTTSRVPVDLAIVKTGAPSPVLPGGSLAWTLTVTNSGSNPSTGAKVTDTLPAGVTFVSASAGCVLATGTVTCTLGTLNPTQSVAFTINVVLSSPYTGAQPLSNTATVASVNEVDTNSANNTSTASTPVTISHLNVVKTHSTPNYTPGSTGTYTVVVTNTGPSTASAVNVSDTLPTGVTLTGNVTCATAGTAACGTVAGTTGQASFTVTGGSINVGGSLTLTVPVAFASSMTTNPIVNTALATDPASQNATGVISTPRTGVVGFTVAKTDGSATYTPGGTAIYVVTLTNAGPSDATNVTVTDALPAGLTLTANASCVANGSATCGTVTGLNGTTSWGTTAATIVAGAGNSLVFTAPVAFTPGMTTNPLVNTVNVTDVSTGSTGTASDSDARALQVTLAATKTDGSATYTPGGTATYVVTVSNSGISTATATAVSDTLPTGVTLTGNVTCVAAGTSNCGIITGSTGQVAFSAANAVVSPGAGNALTYTVPVAFAPGLTTTPLVNTVNATDAPSGATGSATDSDIRAAIVTLVVAKTDGSATYTPGGSATYVVTVSNTGTSDATNVTIGDTLPVGVTLSGTVTCVASGTSTCGTVTGTTGQASFQSLGAVVRTGAGNALAFTAPVKFASSLADNPLVNTATANDLASTSNASGSDSDARSASVALTIAKTDGSVSYTPGGTAIYVVTLTNAGPSDAASLTVTDTLPAGLTLTANASCVANGAATCGTVTGANGTTSWGTTAATLAAGAGNSLVFTAPVAFAPAMTTNPLVNTVNVTDVATGGTGTASDSDTFASQVSLAVTKTDGSATYTPGGTATYVVTVANSGISTATATTVSDTLPAGLTLSGNVTCVAAGTSACGVIVGSTGQGAFSATAAVVSPGAGNTLTYSVPVTFASGMTTTPLANTVNVVDTPSGATGTATDSDTRALAVTLVVVKSDGSATYTPGGGAIYVVNVSNTGASDAANVTIGDTLPAGVTLAGTVTCVASGASACGTLTGSAGQGSFQSVGAVVLAGAGNALAFTVPVGFSPALVTNPLVNTASANDIPSGSNASGTDSDVLNASVALTIAKTDGSASYTPGGTAVYVVTLTNAGPSNANNLTVTDALPVGLTLTANASCVANGAATCGIVTGALGATSWGTTTATLAAGAGNSLVFTSPVAFAPGMTTNPLVNSVNATDVASGATGNASDSDTLALQVSLAATKTDGSATYTPGGTATYVVTVSNGGMSSATATTVSDTLPAGVTLTGNVTCVAAGTSVCGVITGSAGQGAFSATAAVVSPGAGNVLTYSAPVAFAPGLATTPLVNTVTVNDAPSGATGSATDSDTRAVAVTLVVGKTDNSATYTPGGNATYVVTVSNTGLSDAANVTVGDTLPVGVTLSASATCVASGTSTCGTLSGTAGQGSFQSLGAVIRAGAGNALVFTVPVHFAPALADNPLMNTATANDIASGSTASGIDSDARTGNALLAITKTDGTVGYTPGGTATYTIVVSNSGTSAALATSVNDPLPAGVTLTGTPTCVAAGTATCGTITGAAGQSLFAASGASVAPGAGNTITYSVPVAFAAGMTTTPLVNTVTASDPDSPTTSATDADTLGVSLAKSFVPSTLLAGSSAALTITLGNTNATVLTLTAPFVDTMPAGVTTNTGNTGTCAGVTVSATQITKATGSTVAAGGCTIVVSITSTTPGTVTNTTGPLQTDGGFAPPASAPVTVTTVAANPNPDLAITKVHVGTFLAGMIGAQYRITVSNVGGIPTLGQVTVTDALPAPMVATSIAGTGWTCVQPVGPCTRSDVLAPGTSYPVITLAVNVSATPPAMVTNTVAVTGGGDTNGANNASSDAIAFAATPSTQAIPVDAPLALAMLVLLLGMLGTARLRIVKRR